MVDSIPAASGVAPETDGSDESFLSLLEQVTAARARAGNDLEHLPRRLSPSRASDYAQCPQMFFYKTICGIREPGSIQTTRGTIAHTAFERIFDHPAGERTPELAISYIRPAWEEMINLDLDPEQYPEGSEERARALADAHEYRRIASPGSETEAEILEFAAQVVRNWFGMERVNNFSPNEILLPDGSVIDGREFHVAFDMFGVNLHGFIDRIDRWETAGGQPRYSISDYKSGKYPGEGKEYRPQTMERITYEAFFQLRFYALLCWEMLGIKVSVLRLLYVKSGVIKQLEVTQKVIDDTRAEVQAIWKGITDSARTGRWATRTGPLCDYCYFNEICPAINPAMADLPVAEDRRAG